MYNSNKSQISIFEKDQKWLNTIKLNSGLNIFGTKHKKVSISIKITLFGASELLTKLHFFQETLCFLLLKSFRATRTILLQLQTGLLLLRNKKIVIFLHSKTNETTKNTWCCFCCLSSVHPEFIGVIGNNSELSLEHVLRGGSVSIYDLFWLDQHFLVTPLEIEPLVIRTVNVRS